MKDNDTFYNPIHTKCSGYCDNTDGYWWCYKCQDYIEDDEVEENTEEEEKWVWDEWIW